MNNWHYFSDKKPEINKEIEFIDSKNNHGCAYLCHCGNEWRDIICGSGVLIDVVKWRYIDESKKSDK
jgi:hypothetical protein